MDCNESIISEEMIRRRLKAESYQDSIRGCLLGGAIGDALGYPVEFLSVPDIIMDYGPYGISEYEYDTHSGKALISDDTQMSLFTANGLLYGITRVIRRGISGSIPGCIAMAYQDWYMTQTVPFRNKPINHHYSSSISWLCEVRELYSRRAPGNTCLDALQDIRNIYREDYISPPINNSKGCGGVMRVAPLALVEWGRIQTLIIEAAQAAAITHGHPLGYMTASVLCYIINRIVFAEDCTVNLKKIVCDAKQAVCEYFENQDYTTDLARIIDLAVDLSENNEADIENIKCLGAGWVAEEALAIAIYCSLRYQNDFSSGIIAAVNHDGDSDSTGAITGNILGALHGYNAIDAKWKKNLELGDILLEIADDLCFSCLLSGHGSYHDSSWDKKYIR